MDTIEGEAVEFIVCVKDGTDEEELIVDARLGLSLGKILEVRVGPSLEIDARLGVSLR